VSIDAVIDSLPSRRTTNSLRAVVDRLELLSDQWRVPRINLLVSDRAFQLSKNAIDTLRAHGYEPEDGASQGRGPEGQWAVTFVHTPRPAPKPSGRVPSQPASASPGHVEIRLHERAPHGRTDPNGEVQDWVKRAVAIELERASLGWSAPTVTLVQGAQPFAVLKYAADLLKARGYRWLPGSESDASGGRSGILTFER